MRWLLPLLTVLLFPANYWICELFYHNDLDKWWILRTNITSINFMLALLCFNTERTRFVNFLLYSGIGFAMSDVIDRVFFDANQFTESDILMIVITLLSSYYKYYKTKKTMTTLNFNTPYLGLDGKPASSNKDENVLNKIIGNYLVAETKGDALKYYDWATKLYNGGTISVDKSDLKKIRDFVENHESMFILCKAQLIKVIDESKEDL